MSTTRCPQCGAANRPGAHFCTTCGGTLPVPSTTAGGQACPQCGAPLRPGARFCPTCGYATAGDAGGPSSAPVGTPQSGGGDKRMVVRWPGGRQDSHPLLKPVLRVGRALDNDIVLDFPTVSGHHLQLDVGPAEVQVTDLNSTNGTMLKGRRIPPGTSNLWRPGETIRVGDLHGNSISMVLQGEAAPALRTYPLDMHKLAHLNQIIIGRDPASQITLAHPSVSRQHAEISRQNGGRAIRDLGSVNGTFVNGQRVTGLTPLQMGDVVQIGPYKMVYDGQAERLTTSVSLGHRLDAMGIGVQVSGGKMILQDISVTVQGSEFAALVGGSGAGKSTMMKAMNGFHPATHGRMLIDGEPLYPNMDTYRTLMGYVPQDDIIHKTLPVRSALWYSAKLRLPDATHTEIDRRIADVLDMVDMKAHAAKPVKVLSGGQRKRVSIAVELLAEPELLFLDEPTSGLDPGLEKKMMYDLNRLADQGRTVVLVTHATANIEQCNHVAFLVRGNLAYYGPPQEAISFFGTRDFADIYLKLSEEVEPNNTRQLPTEIQPYCSTVESKLGNNGGGAAATYPAGLLWAEHYRRSSIYKQYVQDRQSNLGVARQPSQPALPVKPNRTRDSALRQLFILARRQFDLIRHDVRTLFILLLMMPLIAFLFMMVSDESALSGLTGRTEEAMTEELMENLNIDDESELESGDVGEKVEYIPLQDASNLVTMLGLALTQAGTFGAAYEIVKERAIFRRERAVNLKVVSYVLSKAFVLGSFAVIQVFSVLLIMGLKLDMSFDPIFEFFPSGAAELFVTLFIAVMASIMFGLFISAVVPTQDVVLYIILIQLFTQIILSGTLFPLDNNPASKLVVSYWTMDAMGATVDLNQLNDDSLICQVGEREVPTPQGEMEKRRGIECESAARDELELPYEHTEEHLLTTWAALGLQALLWGAATMFVQSRVKGD